MPTKLCSNPGCPNPATYRGYCAEHARQVNRATHPNKSFYGSRRWRLTARHVRFLHPMCEHCGKALSQEVHHDPPLEVLLAEGRNPYDLALLVALCKPCHGVETRREQVNST
jgi:5-methylcytosine-specific restriction endonuclease McrA